MFVVGAPRDRSVRGCSVGSVCEGMLRGTGLRWGSAGPVLRSQGTLGQEGLSRGRATGIRMSTFLRSLRPDPAAAGLICQSRGRSHLFTQKGTLFTILMSLLGLRGICSAAASWRPKG